MFEWWIEKPKSKTNNDHLIKDKGQIPDIKLCTEMHCILLRDFRTVITSIVILNGNNWKICLTNTFISIQYLIPRCAFHHKIVYRTKIDRKHIILSGLCSVSLEFIVCNDLPPWILMDLPPYHISKICPWCFNVRFLCQKLENRFCEDPSTLT